MTGLTKFSPDHVKEATPTVEEYPKGEISPNEAEIQGISNDIQPLSHKF